MCTHPAICYRGLAGQSTKTPVAVFSRSLNSSGFGALELKSELQQLHQVTTTKFRATPTICSYDNYNNNNTNYIINNNNNDRVVLLYDVKPD